MAKDEVGRSVLEWKPDPIRVQREESDPNARTYDFLQRLDHPDLAVEDDPKKAKGRPAMNPYDHGSPPVKRKKRSAR